MSIVSSTASYLDLLAIYAASNGCDDDQIDELDRRWRALSPSERALADAIVTERTRAQQTTHHVVKIITDTHA